MDVSKLEVRDLLRVQDWFLRLLEAKSQGWKGEYQKLRILLGQCGIQVNVDEKARAPKARPPVWLNKRELAAALGVSKNTVDRLRQEGKIKAIRLGYRTVYYDLEQAQAQLAGPGAGAG
jgi:excisionase family DNA binding protein